MPNKKKGGRISSAREVLDILEGKSEPYKVLQ